MRSTLHLTTLRDPQRGIGPGRIDRAGGDNAGPAVGAGLDHVLDEAVVALLVGGVLVFQERGAGWPQPSTVLQSASPPPSHSAFLKNKCHIVETEREFFRWADSGFELLSHRGGMEALVRN